MCTCFERTNFEGVGVISLQNPFNRCLSSIFFFFFSNARRKRGFSLQLKTIFYICNSSSLLGFLLLFFLGARPDKVRGIETITTYDSNTGEIVINTPCESAQKYWIGGAANMVSVSLSLSPPHTTRLGVEQTTAQKQTHSMCMHQWLQPNALTTSRTFLCVGGRLRPDPVVKKKEVHPQNVDLPPILPKNKKKPYPIPLKKIQQAARADKKLAEMGLEKLLEPPKNGLLVQDLIPVAYDVLEAWKILIKGLSQLLHVVPVYGCSGCSEVHVSQTGHKIKDCHGPGNAQRRSCHSWVKGSINDVLIPVESYHLYDPFGRRIKHETRFNYDRIPAVVELCIQAGVDLPGYPSRRRTKPIRMIGKKVIDRGGFVEDPKQCHSRDSYPLMELDTYGTHVLRFPPPAASDVPKIAQETLDAFEKVRWGVKKLMRKYSVKACGYCSEVHVGPWGHDAKLCGAFKHQWRDGKHGWQDATLDEVIPLNYVWHVWDPKGPPLIGVLKQFYGKAPAVVEMCMQAGAEVPDKYKPMMRLDIVVPDCDEARLAA